MSSSFQEFFENLDAPGIEQREITEGYRRHDLIIENWLSILLVASVVVLFRLIYRFWNVLICRKLSCNIASLHLLSISFALLICGIISLLAPVGVAAILILETYGSLYVVEGTAIGFSTSFSVTIGAVFAYYSTYFAYGEHWGRPISNSVMNSLPTFTHKRVESLLEVPE